MNFASPTGDCDLPAFARRCTDLRDHRTGAALLSLTVSVVVSTCLLHPVTNLFAVPIVLGYAVGNRNTTLTNWGAPLFSSLIGAGLLLLIPAIRKAGSLVADNGTPWRWPYYPLTAFAILIVLAAIRTHAIWMSFGFIGPPVRFEPFLLMPIVLAILVLLVESEVGTNGSSRTYIAMACAPVMLLCGISRGGMTYLPIQADLQAYFGSAHSIALLALAGFYAYVWMRGVAGSGFAVIATMFAMHGFSDLPDFTEPVGLRHWMFALMASLFTLAICLRNPKSDLKWLAFTLVTGATILFAGHDYDSTTSSIIVAAVFTVAALMTIGAFFETDLAEILRHVSAAMLVLAAVCIVLWHLKQSPGIISTAALAGLAVVSIVYMQIVRRLGWLYVFGIHATCLIGMLGWNGYETGSLSQTNWPFQTGLLCFAIGLTITSVKTGVHRRLWRSIATEAEAGTLPTWSVKLCCEPWAVRHRATPARLQSQCPAARITAHIEIVLLLSETVLVPVIDSRDQR